MSYTEDFFSQNFLSEDGEGQKISKGKHFFWMLVVIVNIQNFSSVLKFFKVYKVITELSIKL